MALVVGGACSSGGDDEAACRRLSSVGVLNADYGKLFSENRDLSNDLRTALKDLEDSPSETGRASRVAGLCARHGVTVT